MSVQESLEAARNSAELVPIGEMYKAPWNPRTITPERLLDLRKSMDADPAHLWARPLMRREDGMVIAGNHRWEAAQLDPPYASLPAVPMFGLTDDEAMTIALRDNENYAVWDDREVAVILGRLADRGVDLGLTGFSRESVTSILDKFSPARQDDEPDPDAVPEPPKKPRSKVGEVYELGPHRLVCGDGRDPSIMAKLFGDEKIDVMWTDPPYGVDYVGKTADALTIDNDTKFEAGPLFDAVLDALDEYMKPGARYYVACPVGMVQYEWLQSIIAHGWRYHQKLVWVKSVIVLGHSDYHFRHEDILYGYKPGRGRTGRGAHSGTKWYGGNDKDSVFEVAKPSRSAEHPTMKPIDLILPMLTNSSRRGDNVVDPFGGSGSTLIACEMLGRRCFMSELAPKYCDVIRERYETFTAANPSTK